jgi:outer membrane protein
VSRALRGAGCSCTARFPWSPIRRRRTLHAWLAASLAVGCAPPGTVGGVRSAPSAPPEPWTPPATARTPFDASESKRASRGALLPTDLAERRSRLALADVVDIALGNSPQTRTTWSQARASAAAYGSARGRWLPSIDASATGGPTRSVSQNPARIPPNRTTIATSLSLQYTLLDFGARGGAISAAQEGLYAADFTHNATVQSVVLQAESGYFTYQASLGLRDAAARAVETAEANLSAADRRHEVGLATIADVLQAKTAVSQSQLTAQTAEGNVQVARAQLALAMGLDANSSFEVAADSGTAPIAAIAENVDSLIARAVRERPDVSAARALARQSEALVRVSRSAALPSLTLGTSAGQNYSNIAALAGRTYLLNFGLSMPLFNGGSREDDIFSASENAAAAAARAEQSRLQAVAQVFTSYYALQTATQRVATSAELLTSATQSEEVAAGRYAEGVGSILDLLTAQSVLADARAQSVLARWTWHAGLAQLARDAGVLGPHGEPNLTLTAGSPRR